MIFVLQYKKVGYDKKVFDYSFQITTESLKKTHIITHRYKCWIPGQSNDTVDKEAKFEMRFNKKIIIR
jgi:hypothetical protein